MYQQQQQQDQEHIIPTIRLCLIGEQGFGLSINKLSRATGGQREVLCQNLNKVSNHGGGGGGWVQRQRHFFPEAQHHYEHGGGHEGHLIDKT